MTNAQIIFNEAVELMKNGKIGKTGRQFEVEDENGNKMMLDVFGWKNKPWCVG